MTCVEAERGAPLRGGGRHQRGREVDLLRRAGRQAGLYACRTRPTLLGPRLQAVPHERFEHAVERATTAPRWVADGNYSAVRELLWGRATHVVWLNFGRWTVFSRVLRRTLARGLLRTRLSHGNRESLRMAFCSRDSILLWSWTTFAGNRRKYTGLREIRGSRICAGWRLASRGGWGGDREVGGSRARTVAVVSEARHPPQSWACTRLRSDSK